jgi:hypothetical protein
MEKVLKLGEWATLEQGWLMKRRIMFAGESSPGIYSIAAEWLKNHNAAAYNIYFHQYQSDFPVFNGRITIVDVSGQELRFRFTR